jgi:restriction endonuclease S subunit
MGIIPDVNQVLPIYLFTLLQTFDISKWASNGQPPSIRKTTVEEYKFPLPPIDIQKEIVAEIEGYQKVIDGARAVVENYRPHIHIDPDWPMVELGEKCSFMTGGTPTSIKKEYYENGTIPWLVSGDIHKGEIFDCDGQITEKGLNNSNAKYLPKDSVLIALNGQGKTRGTVAMLRMEKATCNQSLVSIHYLVVY